MTVQHLIIFSVNAGKLVGPSSCKHKLISIIAHFYRQINVVAFSPHPKTPPAEWRERPLTESQVTDATTEELVRAYAGWGSEVTGLLSCVKQPSKWNINVIWPPLQSYVRGRVALMGDAVSRTFMSLLQG